MKKLNFIVRAKRVRVRKALRSLHNKLINIKRPIKVFWKRSEGHTPKQNC